MMPNCVVSDKYKFVLIVIPKNASSTLRQEFCKKRYGPAYEVRYTDLDEYRKKNYFTFVVIRDPVSRLLSAYQEISMGIEAGNSGYRDHKFKNFNFYNLDDTEQRINVFLDDTVCSQKWDVHIEAQIDVLAGKKVDFFIGMEWLQEDMEYLYNLLGMGQCPKFMRLGSRQVRLQIQNYERYLWHEEDLTRQTSERIVRIYSEDLALYRRHVINRHVNAGSLLQRFKIQNQQCFRYLVYHLGNRGFFAEFTTVARAMIYALATGRQLLLSGSEFGYRYQQGWLDYFDAFCGSYDEDSSEGDYLHCYSDIRGAGTVFQDVISFTPDILNLDSMPIRDFSVILGCFSHAIFKLNDVARNEVKLKATQIGLPNKYAAVHIRRGDKVGDEDIQYSFDQYWQKLQVPGIGDLPLFVLSDDYQAIIEVRQWLKAHKFTNTVYTLCDETHTGYDVFAMRRGEACYNANGTSQPKNEAETRLYMYKETLLLLAEVDIASRAAMFVGSYRSNVSQTIWFLKNNSCCELIGD